MTKIAGFGPRIQDPDPDPHQNVMDPEHWDKDSVADPDPYVFGPPGSGSFCHQAKIVRKTLIPTICDLIITFDVNVVSKSNKPKKLLQRESL
jgi:hypothetical protein